MDNEKNDFYYLDKIKNDLKFIMDHTLNKSEQDIEENEILLDSIMFRIIQISENNNHLSLDFKSKHPTIPWASIKGMRNKIVHEYGVINITIIYDTITNGIPLMYEQLLSIK